MGLLDQHDPLRVTLYACFTFFEYVLFSFYLFLHIKNRGFKRFIIATSIPFCLFIVIYYLTVHYIVIDSVAIGIETILILIFSFYYLYTEMNDTSTLFIYNKPAFWIILGMVLPLAGSFFIFIAADFLPRKEVEKYWSVTNVLTICKYIFFSIAILVHSRPNKEDLNYNVELSSLN
jgi:hypothetical protein